MAERTRRRSGILGFLVALLARFWRRFFVRWHQRRAAAKARRSLNDACERREQRLEDADAPGLLVTLHGLVRAAFATASPASRSDVEMLLDRYVDAAIVRKRCISLLREAKVPALYVRRERAERNGRAHATAVLERRKRFCSALQEHVWKLDEQLDELESLIRFECERALYHTALGRQWQHPTKLVEDDGLQETLVEASS